MGQLGILNFFFMKPFHEGDLTPLKSYIKVECVGGNFTFSQICMIECYRKHRVMMKSAEPSLRK